MKPDLDYEDASCEALLVADAALNPEAFAEIYDLYFSRVYNYIKFRVGDPHLTDDLTSQVFETLLSKISMYQQNRGIFAAWLFAIAHNIIIDHFRRQKFSPLVYLDNHKQASSSSQPEDTVQAKELRRGLFKALNGLSDRERNILGLKFWSGLTNRKIAELTGLSESNVGIIIYRALKSLRVYLSDLGVSSYE